jgi:hypothetical protein
MSSHRHFFFVTTKHEPSEPAPPLSARWRRLAGFQQVNDVKKTAGPKSDPLFTVTNMQRGGKLPPVVHNYVMRSWP